MPTLVDPRLDTVQVHLQTSADTLRRTAEQCGSAIVVAAERIAQCFTSGGKLLLCGNGGSAADCQHLAAEFTCRLSKDFTRPGLPALALTTDTSFLTAYANDFDFDGIFARQVQVLGKPGDILIAISTSGSSPNVITAAEAARRQALGTIALTGESGRLRHLVDVAICIPGTDTQHVQEAHLAVEHLLCHLAERMVFGEIPRHG